MSGSNGLPIAIVDYGMGNLQSIYNAFALLDGSPRIVEDPAALADARGVVVPGVGAFGEGIESLRDRGFVAPLKRLVQEEGVPYLGLCLGMQFLATGSTERGHHKGLDWMPGMVTRIDPAEGYTVPHMGWNEINLATPDPDLYQKIGIDPVFYFIHSYHFEVNDPAHVTATVWHGGSFTASVRKDNVYGVQYHPEKSQGTGLKVVENFVSIVDRGNPDG